MKFIEKIFIISLAIIFFIPYQIYRYFKPKRKNTEDSSENAESTKKSTEKLSDQSVAAFSTLEIPPTNDKKAIQSAYRNLAKKHHPDCNCNGNSELFIKIQEAYEKLTR